MIAPLFAALALASTCTASQTRSTFTNFVRAYNAGDLQMLNRLFAPRGDFQWYSSNVPGLRARGDATNRSTLIAYFRRRHAQHDRLTLLRFRFNGGATLGNFVFTLRRSSRDYRGGAPFRLIGKGALNCAPAPPSFIVISLGGPGSG